MQHIPDKELDNLFRDKFTSAEIAPDANLWPKIEGKLPPKKKRILSIYWMAAASIIVVITALLVFNKPEKIQLHGNYNANNVNVPKQPTTVNQIISTLLVNKTKKVNKTTKYLVAFKPQNNKVSTTITEPAQNNLNAVQPINQIAHLPIKAQEIKQEEAILATPALPVNELVIANAQKEPVYDNIITETMPERKGIRNIGDLVNFVVDKIDKRDKKLIKFNTDDDDNSSIVGINVGFVKLNSKKQSRTYGTN